MSVIPLTRRDPSPHNASPAGVRPQRDPAAHEAPPVFVPTGTGGAHLVFVDHEYGGELFALLDIFVPCEHPDGHLFTQCPVTAVCSCMHCGEVVSP